MSEDKAQTSSAEVHTTSTNENTAPIDIVQVVIKIENYESDPEHIFEPEVRLEVDSATPSCSKDDNIAKENEISPAAQSESDETASRGKGTRKPTCSLCGRVFKHESSLARHKRSHGEQKLGTYICHRCQRSFPFKINLIRHLSKSCGAEQLTLVACPICQNEFKTESRMHSHMNTHHTEHPHKCDLCGKRFKDEDAVSRHRLTHAGVEKPFPCTVCDKSFPIVNALQCHMRTHTKERPFQCAVCVRAFSHKHNMLRHMRRHDRVLHLQCEVCHKVFPRESRLKYHMRVHWPDKKPHRCAVCPKTYSHYQNITRHYRKKHPNVEYIPSTTDAEFANKAWEMRMEQSKLESENNGCILPEFQQLDTDIKQEELSDSEMPVEPELVIVGKDVKMEPYFFSFHNEIESTTSEIEEEIV